MGLRFLVQACVYIAVIWNPLFQGMWIPFMGGGEEAAIMAGFTAAWAVGLIILAPIFLDGDEYRTAGGEWDYMRLMDDVMSSYEREMA